METYNCERCGFDFLDKQRLKQHLKKKILCMALEQDIDPKYQLEKLTTKQGIECDSCNKIYKNEDSLRKHKKREHDKKKENSENKFTKKDIIEIVKSMKNEETITKTDLLELVKEVIKIPHTTNIDNSIKNIDYSNKTINVTINSLYDVSTKPINYLLEEKNITQRILRLIKKDIYGILEYVEEKFFNDSHPENKMIRMSEDRTMIELHINGEWKSFEHIKSADLILSNVGNDYGTFLELIKELDDYHKLKKVLKDFEKNIMNPLEWGYEISEDTKREVTKQIIKKDNGKIIFEEDEIEDKYNTNKKETVFDQTIKFVQKMC